MECYSFVEAVEDKKSIVYAGVVKNGNKITLVISFEINSESSISTYTNISLGKFNIPSTIGEKLFANSLGYLDIRPCVVYKNPSTNKNLVALVQKISNTQLEVMLNTISQSLDAETTYTGREEVTFLLSENLAS